MVAGLRSVGQNNGGEEDGRIMNRYKVKWPNEPILVILKRLSPLCFARVVSKCSDAPSRGHGWSIGGWFI